MPGHGICQLLQRSATVSLGNPALHCVPINVFGEGAPSQEAIDYVTGTPQQRARTTLDVFGASLRGEPWELPAGAVSVAFGVEGRREAIDQRVGALDAAKAFRSFNFSAMKGAFNVKEAFGEVLVPLVKGVPGLNNLALSAAARISDYTAYMYLGELIEFGVTDQIFVKPQRKETEDYITGRFG